MADQLQSRGEGTAEAAAQAWRPSRAPTHRSGAADAAGEGRIVEVAEGGGIIGAFVRFIKRPFVRLVIGLGIFILAAIVYDATVNFGEWTEKKEKLKATKHRGLPPVPKTPNG